MTKRRGGVVTLAGAGVAALLLTLGFVLAVLLVPVGVGLPALDAVLALTRRAADRRRGDRRELRLPTGLLKRLRAVVRHDRTWRDLAWQAVLGTVVLPASVGTLLLIVSGMAALATPTLYLLGPLTINGQYVDGTGRAWILFGQGALMCAVAYPLHQLLVTADLGLARTLLQPTRRALMSGRIAELTTSRAEGADLAARELRRIERDLHDGVQAQLTALTITLGLAARQVADEPALALVLEARQTAGQALQGLRDIVHGIHPPVLSERGLTGGLHELALAAPIAVRLEIALDDRLPAPIESALYFTVAELLTNAARHGGASRAWIDLRRSPDIHLTVRDDGCGGALPGTSGGLAGLRRRLAIFDGRLSITSPTGGPTVVEVTLPCAW